LTLTLTGFTTAAFDIEAETAGFVAPNFAFWQSSEEVSDGVEQIGIGGGVGAGGTADRALIDLDDLIEMLQPFNGVMRAW
jgi:hypothetical protein